MQTQKRGEHAHTSRRLTIQQKVQYAYPNNQQPVTATNSTAQGSAPRFKHPAQAPSTKQRPPLARSLARAFSTAPPASRGAAQTEQKIHINSRQRGPADQGGHSATHTQLAARYASRRSPRGLSGAACTCTCCCCCCCCSGDGGRVPSADSCACPAGVFSSERISGTVLALG